MLIDNGADITVGDIAYTTIFDRAVRSGATDVLDVLLGDLRMDGVTDDHAWSSEAYLVSHKGYTTENVFKYRSCQDSCLTVPLGQPPSRFVKAVKHSKLCFSDDGLKIYAMHALDSELSRRIQARTDHPIPAGLNNFLFEVEVVCGGHGSLVAIGLCDESSSKIGMPGWKAGSWAYHGDDGKKFSANGQGTDYGEIYGTGDTICCEVDFNSNTITFYENGKSLGIAFSDVKGRLFPVVGIGERDVSLRIRFSPESFVFPILDSRQVQG